MKTKNEFQGNKGIKALQAKNLINVIGLKILKYEELMQIKGGEYVGGVLEPQDLD